MDKDMVAESTADWIGGDESMGELGFAFGFAFETPSAPG